MTDDVLFCLAVALTAGAALGLYLAQVRARAWMPRRRRRLAGGALAGLAGALPLFVRASGPAAGPFVGLAVLMLATVLLPYADAWRQLPRGR